MTQVVESDPRAADEVADAALQIIAFCCHYCAYAAADLAGALRVQSPPTVRVVKLPCTGKVDVLLLLSAIEHGADGVMVAGCMEGDCHYQRGNFYARQRIERVQRLLEQVGLDADRVRMFNMSSGMGQRWAEAVTEMDAQIRALGPSPLRSPASDDLDALIDQSDTTPETPAASEASPGRPGS